MSVKRYSESVRIRMMYFQYFKINTEEINHLVNKPIEHRRKAYHEIMWLTAGSADFIIDGDQFRVEASAFFIFPKGRIHQFLPNQFVEGHVIRFSEDIITDLPRLLFSRFNRISEVKISKTNQDIFNALFQIFNQEFKTEQPISPFQTHLIKSIIYKLQAIKEDQFPYCLQEGRREIEIFDRFQILMDKYILDHCPIKFYAEQLGVSSRKLNETVGSIMNKTTLALLNERLCIEAKKELYYSGDSISQIAYKLGFEDNSYFTRFFKRHTGISPKKFRSITPIVK